METAKPAFTIKPMANGGPTTSTPKPTLPNSNSVSLRKMTNTEIKISPAERAQMEENRLKMAALTKEEDKLKVVVNDVDDSVDDDGVMVLIMTIIIRIIPINFL